MGTSPLYLYLMTYFVKIPFFYPPNSDNIGAKLDNFVEKWDHLSPLWDNFLYVCDRLTPLSDRLSEKRLEWL